MPIFGLRCTKIRLAAGLFPDPMILQIHSWIWGRGRGKDPLRGRAGEGKEEAVRGRVGKYHDIFKNIKILKISKISYF